jgi:REP element-mobilizing transposase RayT
MSAFHMRRLPHFHYVGKPVFLTWCLASALPPGRVFPHATTSGQAFVAMDRLLDQTSAGTVYLSRPEIAELVVEAIRYRDHTLRHYDLHAFVVMPNHVHLLITPWVPVSQITHSLKRFTAREANRMLHLIGKPFWQDESYDRVVRDDPEFQRIVRYIELNPVKSGLVQTPEEYPWSSARPIDNRRQVANLPHNVNTQARQCVRYSNECS